MPRILLAAFLCFAHTFCFSNNIDSLKSELARTKEPYKQFDFLNRIGESLFSGNDHIIDSSYCMRMLEISRAVKDDSLMAISYNWLGNYFSWTSDYKRALEFFLKGVPHARQINDKRRLSSLYSDISIVYGAVNNVDEERRYLQLAADNLPDPASPMFHFMEIQVKIRHAQYYLKTGKIDSALVYAQAANAIALKLRTPFFVSQTNTLTGQVYNALREHDLAIVHFQKAVDLVDSLQYYYAFNSPKKAYAEFLLSIDRSIEAREQALQTLSISNSIGSKELAQAAASTLQKAYEKIGNVDSAYHYAKLNEQLKDSLLNQNKLYNIQSMAFAESLRLRDEELRQSKLLQERKNQIQYMFIGIMILALVLLFFMLSRSIIVTETFIKFVGILGLLIVFEFINLLIHPFIERITHHSPIFMLLILVCIGALLVPLHHKLEKWVTVKMVEKNKRIRLRKAKLIVEKLEGSQTPAL